jgi:DNA-binding NtrC family response regulator
MRMNKNNTHPGAGALSASSTPVRPALLAVIDDPFLFDQLVDLTHRHSLPVTVVAAIRPALEVLQTQFFPQALLRVAEMPAAIGQLLDAGFQGRIVLLLAEGETAPAAALGIADVLRLPLEAAPLFRQLGLPAPGTAASLPTGLDGLIGTSPAIHRLGELIRTIAPMPSTVLIEGESGTGKEVVAQALHQHSLRCAQPFIAVNCGAISAELIESELFGHVKGAFTGAWQAHDGLFMAAHGGTLFLDEIGELPLAAQAKLLRVLEERRLRRVGAEQEIAVDVRVLAATNRDLQQEVQAGRFRADLFYRLNVVTLTIPPLRQRPEDIPALVQHFSAMLCSELNLPIRMPDAGTLERLCSYSFPGNVRELRNLVMRWLIFGTPALELPHTGRGTMADTGNVLQSLAGPVPGLTLDEVEKQHILQTLAATDGNKTRAARRLGISRRTLERKCARWGV